MLHIKSENGDVEIKSMDGTEKRIIGDLGAAAHKTLLLIANNSKSKEEVFLKRIACTRACRLPGRNRKKSGRDRRIKPI